MIIYTIQTFTILSQQKKGDIGTFILRNIYKIFTITIVSDFKKSDFEINAAFELASPLNKRRIGNVKNLINAAAFKVSATLQDHPRADRCSVSCFYKNPYKPYIF